MLAATLLLIKDEQLSSMKRKTRIAGDAWDLTAKNSQWDSEPMRHSRELWIALHLPARALSELAKQGTRSTSVV